MVSPLSKVYRFVEVNGSLSLEEEEVSIFIQMYVPAVVTSQLYALKLSSDSSIGFNPLNIAHDALF